MEFKEFDRWFNRYLLSKTDSCLDRDILRWAKPILKIGFYMQKESNNELEFKGSQKILDLINTLHTQLNEVTEGVYNKSDLAENVRELLLNDNAR